MKGFYPSNENPVKSFFKNKGFYIILIACLFGVGILGYVTLKGLNSPPSDDEYLYNNSSNNFEDENDDDDDFFESLADASSKDSSSSSPSVSSPASQVNEKDEDDETVDVIAEKVNKLPLSYIRPIKNGTILKPFSLELEKVGALGDWRAHFGVDIASAKLTPVRAAADGEIVYVGNGEDGWGWTVEVKHADNIILRYRNLAPSIKVKEGDRVKQGDTIAAVGSTSIIEEDMEPHLHLEAMKKNDKGIFEHMDPFSFIK